VSWIIPLLHMMSVPHSAVDAHAEVRLTLHQREWISWWNTIAGCRNCSGRPQVQPRGLCLGLVDWDVYNMYRVYTHNI